MLLPSLRCICSTKKLRNHTENTIKMPIKPCLFQKSRLFFNFFMLCWYANIEIQKICIPSLMIAITLGCYNKTLGSNFKAKKNFWSPFHLRKVEKILKTCNFPHTGPKVTHSRPAPKRKYGIFGLGVRKNSIRSTGVKLANPQLVFTILAFGSGGNLHDLWTDQVFSSLGA